MNHPSAVTSAPSPVFPHFSKVTGFLPRTTHHPPLVRTSLRLVTPHQPLVKHHLPLVPRHFSWVPLHFRQVTPHLP
jgi:hypothetical protein